MIQQFHSWVFTYENENTSLKRYVHFCAHYSIIYNNQDKEVC